MENQQDSSGVQSTEGQVETQISNGQPTDNATNDQPQGQGGIEQEQGSNLPPELELKRKELLRDYHSKTQALAEERLIHQRELETLKERDGMLQKLMEQDWFKSAAFEQQRRLNGGSVEDLNWTPEQFEEIKNNPNAFKAAVMDMAKRIAQGTIQPVAGALNEQQVAIENSAADREFESAASEFKDFRELNESGALDGYLEQGYDYASAYKLAKFDKVGDLEAAAGKRAEQILETSRNGAVGTRGVPSVQGNRVLAKPKNLDQALDFALNEITKGNEKFEFQK